MESATWIQFQLIKYHHEGLNEHSHSESIASASAFQLQISIKFPHEQCQDLMTMTDKDP